MGIAFRKVYQRGGSPRPTESRACHVAMVSFVNFDLKQQTCLRLVLDRTHSLFFVFCLGLRILPFPSKRLFLVVQTYAELLESRCALNRTPRPHHCDTASRKEEGRCIRIPHSNESFSNTPRATHGCQPTIFKSSARQASELSRKHTYSLFTPATITAVVPSWNNAELQLRRKQSVTRKS